MQPEEQLTIKKYYNDKKLALCYTYGLITADLDALTKTGYLCFKLHLQDIEQPLSDLHIDANKRFKYDIPIKNLDIQKLVCANKFDRWEGVV